MDQIYYQIPCEGGKWTFFGNVSKEMTDYQIGSLVQSKLNMRVNENRKIFLNDIETEMPCLYSKGFSFGIVYFRRLDSVDQSRIQGYEDEQGEVDVDDYIQSW
jgi:hypothetical protein